MTLDVEAVEIDELVDEATRRMPLGPGNAPLAVDPTLVVQVLLNLLDNAARYSPAGVPPRTVAGDSNGWVEIRVQDAGPGIAEEDRERVLGLSARIRNSVSVSEVIVGFVLTGPIYVLVAVTAIGAVVPLGDQATWQFLGKQGELGLALAADRFMPYGTIVILIGGLLSTVSALNATTYSSTRVSFAMGRDKVLNLEVLSSSDGGT